ncbi:hypothetical protein N9R45_00640 [Flavobacteriaceae bacterium]|jgi:hypothetical protein|nr:hypothetical protein [Flavobacteriaceae bacterium]
MKKLLLFLPIILILSCNSENDNSTIENNCDFTSEIILEEDFNAINTSNYGIIEVELNGDCLGITFGSSGCGTDLWEENLYSTDAFYNVFPLQRDVKMELINDEACLAFFQKTVSFDLTPFQIDGQSDLPLNINGWNEQITYEY